MTMMTAILFGLAQATAPAAMDHAAAPCPTTTPAPPPELAGWSRPVPVAAGTKAEVAPLLTPGTAARVTLRPGTAIAYAVPPAKPATAGTSGGLFAFQVPAAGRYRVALGAGAWIDVVHGDRAATSVAHGHGPACTGIRKTVDFDLQPGRHLLQVAGSTAPTLALMIARLP